MNNQMGAASIEEAKEFKFYDIQEVEHLVCGKCGYKFMPEDMWEHILAVFRDILERSGSAFEW